LNDPELFGGGPAANYVFAGGRISDGKRQHLLVEAMRYVRGNLRLVVAGPPDDLAAKTRLEDLVSRHRLQDKVELRFGFRHRNEIANLVNSAVCCAYMPIDEDSMGYVTMEAFEAAKPVVTTNDSGGLLEVVKDGETGYVTTAEPRSIASALEQIARQPVEAETRGRAARALLRSKQLSWPATVEQLLA
jgi:glycosyltransferase involved in cell wall biosynthesis